MDQDSPNNNQTEDLAYLLGKDQFPDEWEQALAFTIKAADELCIGLGSEFLIDLLITLIDQ